MFFRKLSGRESFQKDSDHVEWGRLGDWDVYLNECIDSTMDRIHVCFAVLLASDDPRTSWFFQKSSELEEGCRSYMLNV